MAFLFREILYNIYILHTADNYAVFWAVVPDRKKLILCIQFNLFSIDLGVLIPPAFNSPDAPGEMGRPVVLPTNMSTEMKKSVDDGWLKNAFNQYASDLISIHRSLPDPRDPW